MATWDASDPGEAHRDPLDTALEILAHTAGRLHASRDALIRSDAALRASTRRMAAEPDVSMAGRIGHAHPVSSVEFDAEHRREQHEFDAEVAASAAAMRAIDDPVEALKQRVHVQDGRDEPRDRREAALAQREQLLARREAALDRRERALDERERQLATRERLADQREIDAELASWSDETTIL